MNLKKKYNCWSNLRNRNTNLKQKCKKKNIISESKNKNGLCVSQGITRKCPTNHHHHLHRAKHENFVKLRRTIENTTGLQSDLAGQVINSSEKWFTKETFKLLKKNLNFVPTQTNFNKTTFSKELGDFYTRIKLKSNFKIPKRRLTLLKKTYSENQQTKPGFQITITTV